MSTRKDFGIIAYGSPADRARVAAIARHEGQSRSDVMIELIRQRFKDLFGDIDPLSTVDGSE